jgi:UDP-N-acetylmuramoyl-L-alanyl-D-glutamate--2,6-diaminopimelate ligase
VFKISLAEMARAIPPYTELMEWADGQLTLTLNFANFLQLTDDPLYFEAYLQSLQVAGISTICCLLLGYPLADLLKTAARLQPVCGRMEVFSAPGKPAVVVDYAHTPDALEKALQAARLHCSGKLWCVFGCGGDRDKGKRPLMGAIAEEFADIVVVTDDNPRTEEPRAIINDILAGMLDAGQAKVMEGRAEAVTNAVMQAKENDVVLVAGKGHEDYQIVGNRRLDYSDRVTVARLLGAVA